MLLADIGHTIASVGGCSCCFQLKAFSRNARHKVSSPPWQCTVAAVGKMQAVLWCAQAPGKRLSFSACMSRSKLVSVSLRHISHHMWHSGTRGHHSLDLLALETYLITAAGVYTGLLSRRDQMIKGGESCFLSITVGES